MMKAAAFDYPSKRDRASRELASCIGKGADEIALRKKNSNLFRQVRPVAKQLNLDHFDQVLRIDKERSEVEVEARITYESLVEATLRHGFLPAVVPQLKSITVGGAISGVGIEASSFRHGLVHDTVREMDVLLPGGRIVTCRADNEHHELFHGIPNSYGTLGYILRATISLIRAAPFVELSHARFESAAGCFSAMEKICQGDGSEEAPDFIDGAVFSDSEHILTTGHFADSAPYASNYRFMRIFYQSIRRRTKDYLRTADYIWRWDTDWFWCSRAFGMEFKPLRMIAGCCGLLGSTSYWKLREFALKSGLVAMLEKRAPRETVIQDVEIPIDRAAEFLHFFHREIGIKPIWLCPVRTPEELPGSSLYRMDPGILYVNFGFWGSVATSEPEGRFNRLIEKKVASLGGRKSLYSTAYFPEEEFWEIYNGQEYARLKKAYDPDGLRQDLYRKCVRKVQI